MLLRTRISLLVILAFAVICIGLALASISREDLIKAQYSGATITDRSTLWRKINSSLIQRMEDKAWIATEDETLLRAVYTGDQEAVQRIGAVITARLREQGIASRFDVLYADGSLAFSSQSGLFQTPVIAPGAARDAIQTGVRIGGIGNDQQRNVAVVLGIPLGAPPGAVGIGGMGVYATSIDEAILEMEQATKSSVLVVNRRGRLLAGTADALWGSLGKLIDLSAVDTLQTVEADDRVYSAVVLPHTADLGSLVARLVSIKDVTDLARRHQQVSQITIGAVIAFLILVLIGLGYYMSRSFAPLTDGVGVLNALSRGDLQARVESAGGRDEVGRIASAVNVFRANLVAFDRFRRSRERQRRRQERFIRREMTQLADTLDEEERVAVLEELDQLEHLVREGPDNEGGVISIADATGSASSALTRESDSLAMTALAFQKMSDRVQSQNQSLREALAAKNAFIALQKELDIAARVQLSLLPDTILLSDTVEITGIMRPAKEVGGDFYDFFRLDQNHIGVAVADVSGKGVPAGLFMVMARTLMRATAVQHIDEPGLVLERVNDFLEQNNSEDLFVTLFYGVLDEHTGGFHYANGGHNPPILVDHHDANPLETTGGVALGMFDGLDYADTRVDMEPGSRLVLFSDGITEAFNDDEEAFGDDRLLDTTRALPRTQGPDRDVIDIVTAVDKFTGEAPQFDDITCVVLIYKGENSEGTDASSTPP
ncbi:MAG: SpoIIE family protein phosphatase [Gammaproteobacteria bacterium]|nr:SpoIIE family protein phosphatase [Gammaproteobacteria bacterium]